MSDIKLAWRSWGADAAIMGGDLLREDGADGAGLETAIVLSLFLDAPAREDDVLPDERADRRGWWADTVAPAAERDHTGSRLWLLGREKSLPEVLRRARDYAEEALQWLVADGICSAVTVLATAPRQHVLALVVRVTLSGGATQDYSYTLTR